MKNPDTNKTENETSGRLHLELGHSIHARYFDSPGVIPELGAGTFNRAGRFFSPWLPLVKQIQRRWRFGYYLPEGWDAPVYTWPFSMGGSEVTSGSFAAPLPGASAKGIQLKLSPLMPEGLEHKAAVASRAGFSVRGLERPSAEAGGLAQAKANMRNAKANMRNNDSSATSFDYYRNLPNNVSESASFLEAAKPETAVEKPKELISTAAILPQEKTATPISSADAPALNVQASPSPGNARPQAPLVIQFPPVIQRSRIRPVSRLRGDRPDILPELQPQQARSDGKAPANEPPTVQRSLVSPMPALSPKKTSGAEKPGQISQPIKPSPVDLTKNGRAADLTSGGPNSPNVPVLIQRQAFTQPTRRIENPPTGHQSEKTETVSAGMPAGSASGPYSQTLASQLNSSLPATIAGARPTEAEPPTSISSLSVFPQASRTAIRNANAEWRASNIGTEIYERHSIDANSLPIQRKAAQSGSLFEPLISLRPAGGIKATASAKPIVSIAGSLSPAPVQASSPLNQASSSETATAGNASTKIFSELTGQTEVGHLARRSVVPRKEERTDGGQTSSEAPAVKFASPAAESSAAQVKVVATSDLLAPTRAPFIGRVIARTTSPLSQQDHVTPQTTHGPSPHATGHTSAHALDPKEKISAGSSSPAVTRTKVQEHAPQQRTLESAFVSQNPALPLISSHILLQRDVLLAGLHQRHAIDPLPAQAASLGPQEQSSHAGIHLNRPIRKSAEKFPVVPSAGPEGKTPASTYFASEASSVHNGVAPYAGDSVLLHQKSPSMPVVGPLAASGIGPIIRRRVDSVNHSLLNSSPEPDKHVDRSSVVARRLENSPGSPDHACVLRQAEPAISQRAGTFAEFAGNGKLPDMFSQTPGFLPQLDAVSARSFPPVLNQNIGMAAPIGNSQLGETVLLERRHRGVNKVPSRTDSERQEPKVLLRRLPAASATAGAAVSLSHPSLLHRQPTSQQPETFVQTKPFAGPTGGAAAWSTARSPAPPSIASNRAGEANIDIPKLADQVYQLLVRRLASERERRGL